VIAEFRIGVENKHIDLKAPRLARREIGHVRERRIPKISLGVVVFSHRFEIIKGLVGGVLCPPDDRRIIKFVFRLLNFSTEEIRPVRRGC
jgi:hypothetical protein